MTNLALYCVYILSRQQLEETWAAPRGKCSQAVQRFAAWKGWFQFCKPTHKWYIHPHGRKNHWIQELDRVCFNTRQLISVRIFCALWPITMLFITCKTDWKHNKIWMRHIHGHDDVQAAYFRAITTLFFLFEGRIVTAAMLQSVFSSFMFPSTHGRFNSIWPEEGPG